jgi:small subunit ribosomal protein S4
MSRYRGPRIRIVRRLGDLPGLTTKTTERNTPPGQHGPSKGGKKSSLSEYGIRLQEKQTLRFNYGLGEKQLFNYVKEARRLPGATGSILLQLLEMRLENIVLSVGLAATRPAARQLVTHGHILVNDKKVDIPSFQCKSKDTITVKSKSLSQKLVKNNLALIDKPTPSHLELDQKNLKGTILTIINPEDTLLNIDDLLIVEFYSRK